ncbi:DUF4160 domain-containing protein [Bullifex porci]|uniref:DUF4160 domain-containing protein n=1 Tax=Bullifex porci TaxID=2606638 RepID=UPI0038B26696
MNKESKYFSNFPNLSKALGFDPRLSRTNNSRHCLELFFFNEENPLEPCHIHVRKHGALAKYWIGEKVMFADNIGFSAKRAKGD